MNEKEKKKEPKVHQFSRRLAVSAGVSEAIVLSYFAERIRTSRNRKDGKLWFFNTIDELLVHFPYFDRSTLAEIINRLRKKKLIEVGNFNRWPQDKTQWFHVPDDLRKQATDDPIYFRIWRAKELGVTDAVILHHLEKRIELQLEDEEKAIYYRLVPARLAARKGADQTGAMPYARRTIEEAIKRLRIKGLIIQRQPKCSDYTFPSLLRKKDCSKAAPHNPDSTPHKPDDLPHKPDETPHKPDNVTHYQPLTTVDMPFTLPQASPAANPQTPSEDNQLIGEKITSEPFPSSVQVKLTNEALSSHVKCHQHLFPSHDDPNVTSAYDGCWAFVQTLTPAQIYNTARLDNRDAVIETVDPLWVAWFEQSYPQSPEAAEFREAYRYVCLDILVTAFVTLRVGSIQRPLLGNTVRVAYELCLAMNEAYNEERIRLKRECYKQDFIDFASPDEDKEELVDLTPAQKTRVLRNAVSSHNDRGWIYEEGQRIWDRLVWSHSGEKIAEKFFSVNQDVTVAELLHILDRCVDVSEHERGTKDQKGDPFWSTRRGVNVAFFFKHLEHIVAELGLSSDFKPIPTAAEADK